VGRLLSAVEQEEALIADKLPIPNRAALAAEEAETLVEAIIRNQNNARDVLRNEQRGKDRIAHRMYECLLRERIRSRALAQTLEDEREVHAAQSGRIFQQVGAVLRAFKKASPELQSFLGRFGDESRARTEQVNADFQAAKAGNLRQLEGADEIVSKLTEEECYDDDIPVDEGIQHFMGVSSSPGYS